MSDLNAELTNLVEEAYQLFGDYRMGDRLAIWSYYFESYPDEAKRILSMAPRDMPRDLAHEWLSEGVEEDDELLVIQQMKCLMPCVLKHMVQGDYLSMRVLNAYIFNKCHCKNPSWKAEEIDFFQRYALIYFEFQLVTQRDIKQGDIWNMEDLLVVFHVAGLDIMPLLIKWLDCIEVYRPQALIELMELILFIEGDVFVDEQMDEVTNQQITEWLNRDETQQIIYDAILNQTEDYIVAGHDISVLDRVVDWLKIWKKEHA